ncbi:MAG: hypothetical protein ACK4XJ_11130 [Fimbriimonadaceae bacterium]
MKPLLPLTCLATAILGTAGCGGTKVNASFVVSGVFEADVPDFDAHGPTLVTLKSQDRGDFIRAVLQIKIWGNGTQPKRLFTVQFDGPKKPDQTVVWTNEFPSDLGTIHFVGRLVGEDLELNYQGKTSGSVTLDRTGDFR